MNKLGFVVASMLAVVGLPQVATAGAPAWCNGVSFDANGEDLRRLTTSTDPEHLVTAIATTLCSSSAEVESHRGEIESARQVWGKKLGMADADWADAVAWAKDTGHSFHAELSAKGLAALTPIDQYKAIHDAFRDASGYEQSDALYVADALDAQLTEVGRLAFIDYCVDNGSVARADGDVVKWAICQADVERFDAAKFYDQVRADTAHDGVTRMWLRLHAYALPPIVKAIGDRKQALIKKDDTYKKIFDVAAKARSEWAKTVGANAKLLELVQAMDAAALFHSRKLLEGCEAKTSEALAGAVSTIPAKAFAAMHDDREDPFKGFAAKAGPMLVNTPVVNLAAIAFVACQRATATADFLAAYLQEVPGVRGPRSAALGAVMGEKFVFDDTNAGKLQYLKFGARPYKRSGGAISSAGGVVKSVKADVGALTVALEKTSAKQEDCVRSHSTNRLTRIRSDGTLEYESICDKTAIVTHDTTWTDFHVNRAHHKWLRPGVVFSAVYKDSVADVVAVWPSKTATAPSLVLGGTVK